MRRLPQTARAEREQRHERGKKRLNANTDVDEPAGTLGFRVRALMWMTWNRWGDWDGWDNERMADIRVWGFDEAPLASPGGVRRLGR